MNAIPPSAQHAADPRIADADRILVAGADPVEAARVYAAAAEDGVAAGSSRLAVLAAAGVGRPANWDEALDHLALAAEQGDVAACGQLLVLAGEGDGLDTNHAQADWRSVRRAIDLSALLKAPAARSVRTSPSIVLIDALATPAMCRWLIAKAAPRVERALVGDYKTGQWVPDPIRTGLAAGFSIVDSDVVMVLTQERLARVSSLVVQQQEAPHVLAYDPGQQYRAHYDFLLPDDPAFAHILAAMGQRVATCLTWLNDDYDGGETAFPKIGWRHRGGIGDAMLFLNVRPDRRPDPATLHAGLPPTRGRKWLLSQWVRDCAQPIV